MVVHFLSPAGTCRTIRSEKRHVRVTGLTQILTHDRGYVQASGL
jgi:hypothetical protein